MTDLEILQRIMDTQPTLDETTKTLSAYKTDVLERTNGCAERIAKLDAKEREENPAASGSARRAILLEEERSEQIAMMVGRHGCIVVRKVANAM